MAAAVAPTPAVIVEPATTVEELESLRLEWRDLWLRCQDATPFQSPVWLIPWWKHLGQGELRVLALRREGRLAGVAPFYVHQPDAHGQRHVLLLGTGISDYLDVLLDAEGLDCGCDALLAYLQANRERWDVCDFQQLRSGSPLLEARIPPGWTSQVTAQETCPVLPLPAQVEELSRAVPGHMLANLRYYRRRLERLPGVWMEKAHPETFRELFDGFHDLHRARWAARGQSGVLADHRLRAFHQDAARSLLADGRLRLYALRVGDRIAASFYGFNDRTRAFIYLSGFDPEFGSLSPGTLLVGHAIEEAIGEGAKEFDFLRGHEAYKYLWGAKGRVNYRRQLWHSPPSG